MFSGNGVWFGFVGLPLATLSGEFEGQQLARLRGLISPPNSPEIESMKNTDMPLIGSLNLWDLAVGLARELSLSTGVAAVVYHRSQDDKWFFLSSDTPEPEGCIKSVDLPT